MADAGLQGLRASLLALAVLLAGCGQTGALYLPEEQRGTEVVTRPAAPPAEGDGASSPESVDSPSTPPSPAPEVTAPEPRDEAGKDKTKKDGAPAPR